MSDPYLAIAEDVKESVSNTSTNPFYTFEPWDGPPGEYPNHKPEGSPFQLGMMMDCTRLRMALAGNQVGKSYCRVIEAIMMMTGELPYCFQYPKDHDTGIKRVFDGDDRKVNKNNIKRFGRRDIRTGNIIDYNPDIKPDGTWDCGNIIGVGPYPQKKICDEKNQQLWICTWVQARDDFWIKILKELIPDSCLDVSRGGGTGFTTKDCVFHLRNGNQIKLKTYDQGWEKVEAFMAWHTILDEEPADRKYFAGVYAHAYTVSFSFTPLRGMSWAYHDLYMPAKTGAENWIKLFHATKYDCPYNLKEEVDAFNKTLKAWEIDNKTFGNFSQQNGRPYYDYEICKTLLSRYVRKGGLFEIFPTSQFAAVSDFRGKVIKRRAIDEFVEGCWEVYEDVKPRTAYWSSQDCGQGHEDPSQAQDASACYIYRKPTQDEIKSAGEWPIIVACLYTRLPTTKFAWLCLYGIMYYNYALLGPETKGQDGASFMTELRSWPHWYKMTVINDKTKKATEKLGFDTNAGTRTTMFDKVGKYIDDHSGGCDIGHLPLLTEMSEIQWLKGRPDHASGKTSDCVVSFGIGLWIFEEAKNLIRDYKSLYRKEKSDDFGKQILANMGIKPEEKRRGLGQKRTRR